MSVDYSNAKIGPAYIADATPGALIQFTIPGEPTRTGIIESIEKGHNVRSVTRTWTLRGESRVYNTSCNFHVEILDIGW